MSELSPSLVWHHEAGWVDLTRDARSAEVPWTVTTENRDRYIFDWAAATVTHLAPDGTPTPDVPGASATTKIHGLVCLTPCGAAWVVDDDQVAYTPRLLLVHREPPHPDHVDEISYFDALLAMTRRSVWQDWLDAHPAAPCPADYCIVDLRNRRSNSA